jgi:hypothetical protein
VGKLFTAIGQLPVGEVRADQQGHPAKDLKQGGADVVLGLRHLKRPVLHEPGRCNHERQPQQSEKRSDSRDAYPYTSHGRIVALGPVES